jgi:hypothetical protein
MLRAPSGTRPHRQNVHPTQLCETIQHFRVSAVLVQVVCDM